MLPEWNVSLKDNTVFDMIRGGDSAYEQRIFNYDLSPEWTAEGSRALRAAWWRKHGLRAKQCPRYRVDKTPDRPLRVGYVSADFNFHSALTVFSTIIAGHRQLGTVIPYCYSSMVKSKYDDVTEVMQSISEWRDVSFASDVNMATMIQQDKIDILVDLSGFTAGNRLPVFAMLPAPIQLHGWGYVIPTTFPCFDAMLADPVVIPEAERQGIERVIDLPCMLYYPDRTLHPDPLPLPGRAPVFGVFNRANKVDDRALRLWARVIDAVPGSKLLFKARDDYSEERKSEIRKIVANAEFMPSNISEHHMLDYHEIDINLDPLTQNGGVSTMEAAWMGVPTVTVPGNQSGRRTSASILKTIGAEWFIASSEDEYVAKATAVVTTLRAELAKVRTSLRDNMRKSPINVGYVQAVEAAYRMLWNEYTH